MIKSFPAVKLIGGIRYGTAKDPDGKWSNFQNGDRFCYIQAPVTVPLPKTTKVGVMPCRIYHRSQRLFEKMCRICKINGHKEKTYEWPHYHPVQDSVTPFRFSMVFFNLYPCDICYDANTFASVKPAYQYTKVKTYEHDDLADQIRRAKDGKEGLKVARGVHEDEAWNLVQVNVMTSLINEKVKSCQKFPNALIDSKEFTLAVGISHPFWASGLGPEMTLCTPPERYPGLNMLGKNLN